jgi:hypothetical protein
MDFSVLDTSSSAPFTDCSVLDAWRSRQIADRSAFLFLRPGVARGLLRAQHLEFCIQFGLRRAGHLSLRTGSELLRIRRLALYSACGLLRTLHLVPHVSRGSLRA